MIVDERDHGLDRRSSSAIAKYALALRRISLAWRELAVLPLQRLQPLPRLAGHALPQTLVAFRLPHPAARAVSPLQPIFAAIDEIAAHCEACSP